MFNPQHAKTLIDQAMSLGADFCELYIERQLNTTVRTLADKVDTIQSGIDFGIGLRLFYGQEILYGFTNLDDLASLQGILKQLTAERRRSKQDQTNPRQRQDFCQTEGVVHRAAEYPLEAGGWVDEKLALLRSAHTYAAQSGKAIMTTKGWVLQRQQQIEIFNSDQLHAQDLRHYTRAGLTAIASDGQQQATGSWNHGGLVGWELGGSIAAEQMGSQAARQALVNLEARPCPSGHMPVVIGNGFGGVIFHEACGHLLETTSVAKQASVFHDQLGEMIAAECVNAVDEGISENAWGSLSVDDEGMAPQRTQLIRNGRLEQFLVDKMGAIQTGYPRTGSGRRQSYRYAPASRMRNTFIEAGPDSVESMVASLDRGLYATHMGGGSVQPGTGEFNFSVLEGYWVEDGKIQYPVKAATLISTGPAVLKQISMVGQDFELACGMCGSVSGSIPASVGQASIRVDDILVGGSA